MQSVIAALRQKWFWMCLNKPFWGHLVLLGVTGVCVLVAQPPKVNGVPSDFLIRFWGMWLQLIGAATVWIDFTKTARDFGEGPSLQKTWAWIKGFFVTPPVISAGANITLGGSICTGRARSRPGINPQLTVEARLSQVEIYVQSIDIELNQVYELISQQESALTDEIGKLATELRQAIVNVENQLKDAFVGSYAVLRFGAIWLVAGILLSSVAVEITNVVQLGQWPRLW